ncbi:MAG: hypothetical protein V4690_00485 [Patescibacteria group bacterium]
MTKQVAGLKQKLEVSLGLSQLAIQKMESKWNEIVENDPYAFIPHELKGKMSTSDAFLENMRFGSFSSSAFAKVLRTSNTLDRRRRYLEGKKLVAVGGGRAYDANWIEEAVLYGGLGVTWVDVSEKACEFLRRSVEEQFVRLERNKHIHFIDRLRPKVVKAEIRTALLNPSLIDLPDLTSVEVWYLARTLGCLSTRSAKIVLRLMGQSLSSESDPFKENCIFIVSALRDDNPSRVAKSSKLYTLNTIKSNLRLGSKRQVKAEIIERHSYFGQEYSAVLFRAK